MRPVGKARAALAGAAASIVEQGRQGATWRELADVASVAYDVAKCSVKNMQRARQLQAVATVAVAGSRRPMAIYAPPTHSPSPSLVLTTVLSRWAQS